jgi:hypothetical protein
MGQKISELYWRSLEENNKRPEPPASISDINFDSPSKPISDSTISW